MNPWFLMLSEATVNLKDGTNKTVEITVISDELKYIETKEKGKLTK